MISYACDQSYANNYVVHSLQDAGAEPDDGRQGSPLVYGASSRHTDLVRMLSHGACTNIFIWNNETALHLSAECASVNIVKELIVLGADWHRRNRNGCTALELAEKHDQLAVVDLFATYEQYDCSGETDNDSSHTSNVRRDGRAAGTPVTNNKEQYRLRSLTGRTVVSTHTNTSKPRERTSM